MNALHRNQNSAMRLKVVACGVFEPELRFLSQRSRNRIDLLFLDAGLHEEPDRLRSQVQDTIDQAEGKGYDAVVVAYGLCGRGTAGLVARDIPVVLLRVHDCITLFLGSRAAYMEQFSKHPGTFYITPGWFEKKVLQGQGTAAVESASTAPESNPRFAQWSERFGEEGARFLVHFHDSWKRNYTRAAYIDTVPGEAEQSERYARDLAATMGWRYERLAGSSELLARALDGEWDSGDMLVLLPGHRSVATGDSRIIDAVATDAVAPDAMPAEQSGADQVPVSEPTGIVALGIDAGGTYTDCVVYDFGAGRLVSKAKALTTRHDLSAGIEAALDQLSSLPDDIAMVALSTTLATNSMVEDKGGRPGALIMAPFAPPAEAIKWPLVRMVSGIMTIGGDEVAPPDCDQIRQAVRELLDEGVDAFAISGYGSVRNPSHENIVRQVIEQDSDLPVVCGHQLSAGLNYVARANTAILNGRLLAVIHQLVGAVRTTLQRRGIDAPLMVVKGDGSLVSEATALQRPVDTALSGPAASVVGARFLTGVKDGLVFDMGGTTTDAAVITGGLPRLSPDGASVNGWRTSVAAADIATIGLGGDSHISFTPDRRLQIGPRRVVPLSHLAWCDEAARDQLMTLDGALIAERTSASALDFFSIGVSPADTGRLDAHDCAVLEALRDGPVSRTELARRLNLQSPQLLRTERLEAAGHMQRCALTPTDLLHVSGEFTAWDVEAATHALTVFADLYGDSTEAVAAAVYEQMIRRLCLQVLTSAHGLPPHDNQKCDCPLCGHLLDVALSEQDGRPVDVTFACTRDLVAIGAPVQAFFPEAARRLSANLIIPEHAEVANAIGAAASEVIAHEQVVVRPSETGAYVLHSRLRRHEYAQLADAIAAATATSRQLAVARAAEAGAARPAVRTAVDRREARLADGSTQLIEVKVSATAAGLPSLTTRDDEH